MTSTDGLAPRAARGAAIVVLGQLARTGLLFISTIVLSRLLSPGDFGLLAIALSVLALGELIRDSGLGIAAIRQIEISRAQKNNLFWINLGLGILTGAVVFALAPVLAMMFGQPDLLPMLQWISLCLVLSGFTTQFRAELNQQMRFLALTIVETLPAVLGLAIAIGWAVAAPSFWALVAQQLSTALVGAILACVLSGWWPGLPRKAPMREFLHFGAGLLGTQLLAYGARNADNFMIGLVSGTTQLGFYSRAYQLLMAPMNQLLAPLTRVAVPILSSSATDVRAFNSRLLAAQTGAGVPLAAAYALGFGLAPALVPILLGDQWSETTPIFQALCIGGIFRALNQATYWAFVSTSTTSSLFRSYLVTQPIIIVFMALGLPWGGLGVAWGHSLGYALSWFVSALWCSRTTIVQFGPLIRQAATTLFLFVAPLGITSSLITAIGFDAWAEIGLALLGAAAWGVLAFFIPPARQVILNGIRMLSMLRARRSGR